MKTSLLLPTRSIRRVYCGVAIILAGLLYGPTEECALGTLLFAPDSGSGWTLNGTSVTPSLTGDGILTLTDGQPQEAATAFYNTRQYVGDFTVSFIYQATAGIQGGLADGVAFVIQNDPLGMNALGGTGGSLGYQGITPSAAIELNLYTGHTVGTGYYTGGNTGQYINNPPYIATLPVNLDSRNPIMVTLTYDGTILKEQLQDMLTLAIFSQNYAVNIPAAVAGSLAYVGFSGSSGGWTAVQTISNFSFASSSSIPEPSIFLLGGIGGLVWGGYVRWKKQRTA